jgi:hypothetical protein
VLIGPPGLTLLGGLAGTGAVGEAAPPDEEEPDDGLVAPSEGAEEPVSEGAPTEGEPPFPAAEAGAVEAFVEAQPASTVNSRAAAAVARIDVFMARFSLLARRMACVSSWTLPSPRRFPRGAD